MEHDLNILMIFGIKIDNFDPFNVFLAVAANIPQRLNTAFVLQGHIYVVWSINRAFVLVVFVSFIF